MATGIPKPRSQQLVPFVATNGDFSLEYRGKAAADELLSTSPASINVLWQGKPSGSVPNRLYFGDNLPILQTLLHEPKIRGHVSLVYIDPPFSTKSIFESRAQKAAYEDVLGGASFIEFLRRRLIVLHELLSDRGSIYLHLDENMVFPIKVIMDEIFGAGNFRNFITRKKCNTKNYTRKTYGNISDYILFYTKTDDYIWHRPLIAWDDERARREYIYTEPQTGRRFKKVPVHAPGVRHGETGKAWRGVLPPPGKHWQFPPRILDEMDARGEIHWSANGNPRRKIYLDQSSGIPVQDIWLDFKDAHNQNIEITGYPTEKNPHLLEQIINASSNEGDLVIDCFAGSGTTLAVASRLGRHWIGMDSSLEAIETMLRRFKSGAQKMGDYVRRGETDEVAAESTDLFPDLEVPNERAEVRHKPICDFSLYQLENAPPMPQELIALLEVSRELRVREKSASDEPKKVRRRKVKYTSRRNSHPHPNKGKKKKN